MTLIPSIDEGACSAHGDCVDIAPGVFALGVFLAGLGGALQIPRNAASHGMDLAIIVEAFVVVVIGGLGSVPGAFLAALVVSQLNAFGILVLPKISLVLVFLVMALVLVVRPHGLLGTPEGPARTAPGPGAGSWPSTTWCAAPGSWSGRWTGSAAPAPTPTPTAACAPTPA